jgi:hypothetical protein
MISAYLAKSLAKRGRQQIAKQKEGEKLTGKFSKSKADCQTRLRTVKESKMLHQLSSKSTDESLWHNSGLLG